MSIHQHIHHTPPATITRTVVSLSGSHDSDIAVHHARTADARISFTLGEVLMVFYSCAAVQGLLAAFASAKQHGALIPAQSPITVAAGDDGPSNRITVAIDWTRAPSYAAVAQSGLNKLRSHTLRWIDLYTAGITWQIRDRAALNGVVDSLANLHTIAVATFLDGAEHCADPLLLDFPAPAENNPRRPGHLQLEVAGPPLFLPHPHPEVAADGLAHRRVIRSPSPLFASAGVPSVSAGDPPAQPTPAVTATAAKRHLRPNPTEPPRRSAPAPPRGPQIRRTAPPALRG